MATKPDECSWEKWYAWPWCSIPGCTNKVCLGKSDKYCWPHCPGPSMDSLMDEMKTPALQEHKQEVNHSKEKS